MAEEAKRDPEEALDEIRDKQREGDDPSEEEREFLEAERVPLEPDEGGAPADEGQSAPTY